MESIAVVENSSVRKHSSIFQSRYKKNPGLMVSIVCHVVKQMCKYPAYQHVLCMQLSETLKDRKDESMNRYLLQISNLRCKQQLGQIAPIVAKIKKDFCSLRQASRVADMNWSTFHKLCSTDKVKSRERNVYCRKLTRKLKQDIAEYYQEPGVSMELPDKRYVGTKFMLSALHTAHRAYRVKTGTKISFAGMCSKGV